MHTGIEFSVQFLFYALKDYETCYIFFIGQKRKILQRTTKMTVTTSLNIFSCSKSLIQGKTWVTAVLSVLDFCKFGRKVIIIFNKDKKANVFLRFHVGRLQVVTPADEPHLSIVSTYNSIVVWGCGTNPLT